MAATSFQTGMAHDRTAKLGRMEVSAVGEKEREEGRLANQTPLHESGLRSRRTVRGRTRTLYGGLGYLGDVPRGAKVKPSSTLRRHTLVPAAPSSGGP
ncbi:MAG: hypothetical protein QOH26_375 [Actinomycetota bacterium]|nr:hypothetical protein [Actinomycetota bacterium]